MNIDLIEIINNGTVQVRTIVQVDGSTGWEFQRHTIAPGEDYSAEEARVQAICAAVHTQDVINAYKISA